MLWEKKEALAKKVAEKMKEYCNCLTDDEFDVLSLDIVEIFEESMKR